MENLIFLAVGFTLGFGVLNIKNALKNLRETKKISKSLPKALNNIRFKNNDIIPALEDSISSSKQEIEKRIKIALEDEDYLLVKLLSEQLKILNY